MQTGLTPLLQRDPQTMVETNHLTISQDGMHCGQSALPQSSHLSFFKSMLFGGIDRAEAWGGEKRISSHDKQVVAAS